jgi:DNA-binding response OmpR family regulator
MIDFEEIYLVKISTTHPDESANSGVVDLNTAMSAFASIVSNKNTDLERAHYLQAPDTMPRSSVGARQRSTIVKSGLALPSASLRIALLEDNQIESSALVRLFQDNGYKIISCSLGVEFLKLLKRESFDLLILDWNVPDHSGIEVLHLLRHVQNLMTPVMMLTNRCSEYDIVQALNRGADDYLQKPWQPFEIIARANALLRRQHYVKVQQDESYSNFTLDSKLNQVTHKGKTVRLSNKEFLLAQLLFRHLGSPVSRAHITQTVWNNIHVEARTLDVHVSRLRQKLNLTMEEGFCLTSIYGYGYRLEKLTDPKN